MAPRKQPAPKPVTGRIVGDLNAPHIVVKFDGMFPEIIGVGENWTVAMASKWLVMSAKDSIPNDEIRELFLEAFLPSNPDLNAAVYPARLQLRAIAALFSFRTANIEPETEIVRNAPMQMRRNASSG